LALALSLALSVFCAFLFLGFPAHATEGVPRYVAPGGADVGACASPFEACASVQYAVDQAGPGDEVKVAGGFYTGVEERDGHVQMVSIDKTITLRGGYAFPGFAEPPDPAANPTVLDAEKQGRVLYCEVQTGDPEIEVTLEGLAFTGGFAEEPGGNGGGLYFWDATVIISDTLVYSNTAEGFGGGLYLAGTPGTVRASRFLSNTVDAPDYYFGGGGVYIGNDNLPVVFVGNDVSNNTSTERGGGLYLGGTGWQTYVGGNTFVGNRGLGREGGAIHMDYARATVEDNWFSENEGHWGAGVYAAWSSEVTLTANIFFSNTVTVYSGGAVCLLYSDGLLDYNIMEGNVSAGRGGGVHMNNSNTVMRGNILNGNRVLSGDGGGVNAMVGTLTMINNVVANNEATGNGGGLSFANNEVHLLHTTLADNSGAGAYVASGSVHFTNTIVYSHTQGVVNDGADVFMTQTLWDSNGTPTVGTIIEEGSFNGTTAFDADGFHLTAASDAIDAGILGGEVRDLENEPRLGLPDIGADEYWASGDVWYTMHLPLITSEFISFFDGPWEVEPNNDVDQANGPLRSGRDYYGYPDEKECFVFYSPDSGNKVIDLLDYAASGVELRLYYETVGDPPVQEDLIPPYDIDYTGPAGWYYIYIYSTGGWNTSYPYALRATYR
jgi:hypothetical protein